MTATDLCIVNVNTNKCDFKLDSTIKTNLICNGIKKYMWTGEASPSCKLNCTDLLTSAPCVAALYCFFNDANTDTPKCADKVCSTIAVADATIADATIAEA